MPRFKITYIFDMPKHGFTESWYVDSETSNLDVVRDRAAIVAEKRALLMGDGCTMQAVRISNDDLPGRVGKTYAMIKTGSSTQGAMASNVAVNCIFGTADNNFQKLVQLRGCWDNWEGNGGALLVDTELNSRFQGWRSALIGNGFGFKSIVSRVPFAITGYTTTPSGLVSLVAIHALAPATNLLTAVGPVGTTKAMRFSRVNGKSRLNGVQVAVVTGPTELQLAKPLALTAFVTPGRVEVPSFTVRTVQNGDLQRLGKRQAGAPLLASVGRRSAIPRT